MRHLVSFVVLYALHILSAMVTVDVADGSTQPWVILLDLDYSLTMLQPQGEPNPFDDFSDGVRTCVYI
jgi:hypothetical protein